MKKSEQQAALAFKALGEPRRLEIMRLLRAGPRAVGEIAADIEVTQQAASQHLAILSNAGLVQARREGTRALYSIKPEGFVPVTSFVESFWGSKLAALKRDIEAEE